MTRRPIRDGSGTFVPARAEALVPALEAQALRESIEDLTRLLSRMTGQTWRLTRVNTPAGECADCGERCTGDQCPNCGTAARGRA